MSGCLLISRRFLQKSLLSGYFRVNGKHGMSPFRVGTQSYHSEEHSNPFGNYDTLLPEQALVYGIKHIPVNTVPPNIPRPPYTSGIGVVENDTDDPTFGDPYSGDGRISLGSEDETKLRKAASIAKSVLGTAERWLKPGVSTQEIDSLIHNLILSHGAYPSPLGYAGFPKSCCTSVNNVIVHGIPDSRPLCDGDIINIDVTVYAEGFHGDTSDTFAVGNVDQAGLDLIRITREALKQGIMACGPNRRFSDIGRSISDFIAPYGYSINDQFTGHGIGKVFHRPPWILHSKNDEPGVMYPGHVFTIEPAIVQGTDSRGWILPDGWTVLSESLWYSRIKSGARSAQAEHTILITDTGAEVLT